MNPATPVKISLPLLNGACAFGTCGAWQDGCAYSLTAIPGICKHFRTSGKITLPTLLARRTAIASISNNKITLNKSECLRHTRRLASGRHAASIASISINKGLPC